MQLVRLLIKLLYKFYSSFEFEFRIRKALNFLRFNESDPLKVLKLNNIIPNAAT